MFRAAAAAFPLAVTRATAPRVRARTRELRGGRLNRDSY